MNKPIGLFLLIIVAMGTLILLLPTSNAQNVSIVNSSTVTLPNNVWFYLENIVLNDYGTAIYLLSYTYSQYLDTTYVIAKFYNGTYTNTTINVEHVVGKIDILSTSILVAQVNATYYTQAGVNATNSTAVMINHNGITTLLAINETYLSSYLASDGNVYVLTLSQDNQYTKLWSESSPDTPLAQIPASLLDPWSIRSFAYDPINKIIVLSHLGTTPLRYNVSVYNVTSNTLTSIRTDAPDAAEKIIILNSVAYWIETGDVLYIYNETNNKLLNISLNIQYQLIPQGRYNVIKLINNKIVVLTNMEDFNSNWLVQITEYDPALNYTQIYSIANITEILPSLNSSVGPYLAKDIDLSQAGTYRIGLVEDEQPNGYVLWYILDVQQSSVTPPPPPPPPPQPPTQKGGIVTLDKLYTWGGNKSYEFINYHEVNSTFGFITASSAIVYNGVVDYSTLGIAVFSVNYIGDPNNPIIANMLIDANNLINPKGTIFILYNKIPYIIFYGSNLTTGEGMIVAYNTINNTIMNYTYSQIPPIINAFNYLETYNASITYSSIILVDNNGTLYELLVNNNFAIKPINLTLTNLSKWNIIDRSKLVGSYSIPFINMSLVVSLEPSVTGDPELVVYILDRTPVFQLNKAVLNQSIIFRGEDISNLSIQDVHSYSTLTLINVFDNTSSTSLIYVLNLTNWGIRLIYANSTVKIYKYHDTYQGYLLLGSSYIDNTTNLTQALILNVFPYQGIVGEFGSLTSNVSNEEIMIATIFNNTFLTGIGISYASPTNLTLSGTLLAITPLPVPESEIVSIAVLTSILAVIMFYRIKYRKKK